MGKEHDGVKTIIEMVHGTRLDSSTGSAALMRQALVQVIIYLYVSIYVYKDIKQYLKNSLKDKCILVFERLFFTNTDFHF